MKEELEVVLPPPPRNTSSSVGSQRDPARHLQTSAIFNCSFSGLYLGLRLS